MLLHNLYDILKLEFIHTIIYNSNRHVIKTHFHIAQEIGGILDHLNSSHTIFIFYRNYYLPQALPSSYNENSRNYSFLSLLNTHFLTEQFTSTRPTSPSFYQLFLTNRLLLLITLVSLIFVQFNI